MFTPVRITADPPPVLSVIPAPTAAPSSGVPAAAAASDQIEIALPDGTCIRVGADVGLVTLRRVMAAVRR
jgi:transposase